MGRAKVKMSKAGARAVLRSGGVEADLLSRAKAIAAEACSKTSDDEMRQPPFSAFSFTGLVTAKARAEACSIHGIRASNKNAVLQKSIDAGR